MLRSQDARSARRRRIGLYENPPNLENLEGRLLLYATSGGAWVHPERITFSFAPDGTNIAGSPSSLYASLAARGISASVWQDQFRRAAALWQQVAGINLAEVPDDGSPFGAAGHQQNDPDFGDIRIGAIDLNAYGALGLAFSPPPFNGSSLAGDIVMNSQAPWNINSNYDVQTVAIHEIGHALGLDHSAVGQAVMYAYYNAPKQSLTTDDVAGMQAVYGPRQPDWADAAGSNQYWTTATTVTIPNSSNGLVQLSNLEISRSTDYDWFQVAIPALPPGVASGTIQVTMQSSGLSLLSPKVQLYQYNGVGPVGLVQTPNSTAYGDTITVSWNASPGDVFYVRAMAGNNGVTSAGAYGLSINVGIQATPPITPPETTVLSQPDQGGGAQGDTTPGGDSGDGHDHGKKDKKDKKDKKNGPQTPTGFDPGGSIQLGNLIGIGDMLEMPVASGEGLFARSLPGGPMTMFAHGRGGAMQDGAGLTVVAPFDTTPFEWFSGVGSREARGRIGVRTP